MTMNNSGVIYTARVLEIIMETTVVGMLKKPVSRQVKVSLKQAKDVIHLSEADEQWSFVQNKKQQCWLWYALDKLTGKVIAYAFGRRNDATLKKLLGVIKIFDILQMTGTVMSICFQQKSILLESGTRRRLSVET